jgi:hypothetical protein
MRAVVDDHPILNSGSFAMKLLWEIYEAAADYLEKFEEVMAKLSIFLKVLSQLS